MATQVIRNLDSSVINKISDLAKKKNISREEYCRRLLEKAAIAGEVIEIENKYANLVNLLEERAALYNETMEYNNFLLEKLMNQMEENSVK